MKYSTFLTIVDRSAVDTKAPGGSVFISRGVRACLVLALTAVGLVASPDAPAMAAASTVPGTFVSTNPTRLLDTRLNLGGSVIRPGGTLSLQVLGVGPIPADGVSAVMLNVTAVLPTAAGYLTVWPEGGTRPVASNLNFAQGQTVANAVVAQVGADGRVDFFNYTGSTQVIADVSGYYVAGTATEPGSFVSTFPTRLLDTRKGVGGTVIGSHGVLALKVTGAGPVPTSGVSAVLLNVTATTPSVGGYVTAYADGTARPTASSLNFTQNQTVPNLVVAPVGANGKVDFFNYAGTTQLIADVAGYVLAGTPETPALAGTFHSTAPTRLLDTRTGLGGTVIGAGGTLSLQIAGRTEGAVNVPSAGVKAVALNVTVTQPTGPGYVAAWPDGTQRPTSSNLNFDKAQTVANLVVVPVGVDGKVNFYNSSASTQLVADIEGYFFADTTPPGPVTALSAAVNSATSVTVSWVNPTDDDFAGVLIRRIIDGQPVTGSVNDGVGVGQTVGSTTSFTDTSASASTTYTYEVFAFDGDNNVATATTITGVQTPTPDLTPPGPVTNVVATTTATSVTLSWTNPTDSDFADVVIRRAAGGTPPSGPGDGVAVTTTTTNAVSTFTDRTLPSSTQYSYALFALDSSGNIAPAATTTAMTLAPDATPPGAVTGLTISTPTALVATLNWTNPGDGDFAGVVVCRAQPTVTTTTAPCPAGWSSVADLATPRATFTDIGLTAHTSYTYSVFAYDTSRNYAAAATVSATTPSTSTHPGPVLAASATTATADALPTVQIDGVAWSQVVVGNIVFVGGSFANARPAGAAVGANQTPRTDMLAYDITTGNLITSFAPTFNGQIRAMSVSPDKTRLFVGGDFTTVNGAKHDRVAAFNLSSDPLYPTATLAATFTGGTDATVRAMTASNTAVFVGGSFSTANGAVRTRLASFQVANGTVTSWAPTADNVVAALLLTPDSTKVVVAGSFDQLNSVSMKGIGAVQSVGTGPSVTWKTNTSVHSYGSNAGFTSLSTDGKAIFGSSYVYKGTGNLEGSFSAGTSDGTVNWVEDCHGDTYGTYPINGVLYTVSHAHDCSNVGGFPDTNPRTHHRAVAFTTQVTGVLNPNSASGYPNEGGKPSPSIVDWFPDMVAGSYTGLDQAGWSVTGNSKYLVEGGEFPTVNGVAQQGLVRFAMRPTAPDKSGPIVLSSKLIPTYSTSPGSGAATYTFPSAWDRDDLTLYYKVARNNVTIWSGSGNSEFWNLPTLTFTDTGLTAGTTYKYKITVTDADGNVVAGNSTSIQFNP